MKSINKWHLIPTEPTEGYYLHYKVMTHGADHDQYRSYAYSGRDSRGDFVQIDHLAWGHGDNDSEAYEDAVQQIAVITDIDPSVFPNRMAGISKKNKLTREERRNPEWSRVVSIAIHKSWD